jgi:hypothetical protein
VCRWRAWRRWSTPIHGNRGFPSLAGALHLTGIGLGSVAHCICTQLLFSKFDPCQVVQLLNLHPSLSCMPAGRRPPKPRPPPRAGCPLCHNQRPHHRAGPAALRAAKLHLPRLLRPPPSRRGLSDSESPRRGRCCCRRSITKWMGPPQRPGWSPLPLIGSSGEAGLVAAGCARQPLVCCRRRGRLGLRELRSRQQSRRSSRSCVSTRFPCLSLTMTMYPARDRDACGGLILALAALAKW